MFRILVCEFNTCSYVPIETNLDIIRFKYWENNNNIKSLKLYIKSNWPYTLKI
jgi:hypothetical protein